MSLSVACPCGAKFEVKETYAGQLVACPECQRSVRAGQPADNRVRTSGFAIASLVLALAAGLTFIGPLAAILSGLVAHVQIAGSNGRLVGRGYANAGMLTAVGFALLSSLMFVKQEAFDLGGTLREQMMAGKVKYDGSLERINEQDGYAVTRPSERWGEFLQGNDSDSSLRLVCPSKGLEVEILREDAYRGAKTLEDLRKQVYQELGLEYDYRSPYRSYRSGYWSGVRVRKQPQQTTREGYETMEFVIEGRLDGERKMAIIRLVKSGTALFQLWAFGPDNRFNQNEAELRKVLDSFRVLATTPRRPFEEERR